MRMRVSFLLVLLVFVQCNPVFGASKDKEKKISISPHEISRWVGASRKMSRRYEEIVRDIRLGNANIDNRMHSLRAYYPYTQYYDPFSKRLLEKMTLYAYKVDTSKDRVEVNESLGKFRDLVFKHIAHLDVVTYALTLSRLDVRFGDELFFEKVRDAIRKSWEGMGNIGLSPDHPYYVITYAEETYILETYGAEVEKSEVFEVAKKFYDVREIVTEDGDNMQLFFDVTSPIRTVTILRAIHEEEEKVIIPIQ